MGVIHSAPLGTRTAGWDAGRKHRAGWNTTGRSGLGRQTIICALMRHISGRELSVLPELKNADGAIVDVAVLVEGNFTLQRSKFGLLNGVPHV